MARRIVHVFPSHSWGGAEIYMLELAEAQSRANAPSSVVIWVPAGSRLDQEARARKLEVINDFCPSRFSFSALWRVPAVLKRERITHIVGHWSGAVWAFLALKFIKAPPIFILHIHMWIGRVKRDFLHQFLYANVDAVIIAGQRARAAALQCLPIRPDRLVIIPYAIHAQPAPGPDRTSWGWKPDDVVFGMFARIDKQKGQREFVEALQILAKEPSLRAVIVGDATAGEAEPMQYAKDIDMLIKKDPDLRSIVTRSGFRADFAQVLAACDVLVAPSYHESYALILLHAFSLGVPVLSTDSGGTPDLVLADSGWLVPPKDPRALAAAMREILRSPQQRRAKSKAARAQVREQHSFENILAEYEKVLSARR